jgi:hypothetical protein
VDAGAERQQGFLLWMRRNGFRVIQKELKTFYDGSRKANLDVEIAVDMLSLAGRYDTAVLVSGDEDFVYAVNAVAYKGCRVEVAGFRSNTAPKLIDVADFFIDLGDIAEQVRKEWQQGARYDERGEIHISGVPALRDAGPQPAYVPAGIVAETGFPPPVSGVLPAHDKDELDDFIPANDFVRVTDEH